MPSPAASSATSTSTRLPVSTVARYAIGSIGTQQFVYRVEPDGSAKQVRVTLGARRTGEVEITAGLEEGQQVVTDGLVRMRDGIKVLVKAPAPAPAAPAG